MSSFSIGRRQVGRGRPCFITFEAGPTHSGVEAAIALTRLAAEAGADAIKFQILDPDRLCADRKMPFSYDVLVDRASGRRETITEPLWELLRRRWLSEADWQKVKAAADECGIAFFATAGFPEEIDFLAELGCHSIKIASGDVNHLPLIRRAARTGMSIQLDTGNSTLGEIERAVDVCRAEGNEKIIIHQCPSGYPARIESINLNIIRTLIQMFPFPIAYSDHTPGWDMDVAALALGANLLEKTITFDRTTRSVEHIFSLEPAEMRAFVCIVRDVERAMGQPRRVLHAEEIKRRIAIRRSTWLPKGGRAGDRLGDLDVEFRRPGDGIPPDVYETLADRRLAQDHPSNHKLALTDLS